MGGRFENHPTQLPTHERTHITQIESYDSSKLLENLVGASGFEPPTSWSRTFGQPLLQAYAGICKSSIQPSLLRFLNDFQSFRFAPVCSQLPTLDARKGQEKGKVT